MLAQLSLLQMIKVRLRANQNILIRNGLGLLKTFMYSAKSLFCTDNLSIELPPEMQHGSLQGSCSGVDFSLSFCIYFI